MKNQNTCLGLSLVTAITLSALTLGGAAPAMAQDFEHSSNLIINPDFNSGDAWGYVGGRRALATSISSYIWTSIDESEHAIYFHCSVTVEGRREELNGLSPYQQFMLNHGIETRQIWSDVTITFDHEQYIFDTRATLDVRGMAGISRTHEGEFVGKFVGITTGYGMVPVYTATSVTVYDGDVGRNPEFIAHMDFTYMLTNYHLIPTPGSCALLGLGGLVAARRRR